MDYPDQTPFREGEQPPTPQPGPAEADQPPSPPGWRRDAADSPLTGGIDPPDPQSAAYAPAPSGGSALSPRHGSAIRWPILLAWMTILGLVFFRLALPLLTDGPNEVSPLRDPLGSVLIRLQGRVVVAWNHFADDPRVKEQLEPQLKALNAGAISQRLRYVVLAGEVLGREAALSGLADVEQAIREARREPGAPRELEELPPEVVNVQEILREIYTVQETEQVSLTQAEQDLLVDELDWFGELALYPPWTGDQTRRGEVLAPAIRALVVLLVVLILLTIAGAAGFVGLVVLIVLAFAGRLRSGMAPAGTVDHGIYAETFAIWLVLFAALQIVAGSIATPPLALLSLLVAFFASLLALVWPVIRGAPWGQVRRDIGWTAGREPVIEPLLGPAGYAMTLPLVVVGIMMTLALIQIDALFAPPGGPLDPAGGPAHPVVLELAEGDPLIFLQVLLLGAVAAPIIEETMFRGVLYRHLRGASASLGIVASIIFSTFLNTLVFAVIHPQSWVAWPALMSLAVGFTLMREWRGTLLPSMLMHGISNGLVLTTVTLSLAD